MSDVLAPPFAYFGGKQSIASSIVALLPEHGHYVEPFAGGMSVLLAKPASKMETVNDLDGDLMLFWRVLRDRPEDLARVCALTPHARAEHALSYDRPEELDEMERARRVWVKISQGRGGQLVRTGWRHYVKPAGGASMPTYLDGYVERMAAAAARLHNVSLECRPALDVIASYGRDPSVLLYVDPPYLGETRGTSHAYRHEMRAEEEHEQLAAALHEAQAMVVLSGYHSPLYDSLYAGWHRVTIEAFTGQGNGRAGSGARTEVVWSNRPIRPEPSLLDALAHLSAGQEHER